MSTPFFLVGPTAVGKTELAVRLAERTDAEIVSADAFQVYEGYDLLSAKPTPEQRRRVPHHLIGFVPAAETYSVACYLAAAQRVIKDITARGKGLLVVGGSGLYVKALTNGLAPLPDAQPALRAELEALSGEELLVRLGALDPVTAAVIDGRNKRRVVRALEVCLVTGRPFSTFRTEWQTSPAAGATRGIFLCRDRDDLVVRIHHRLTEMFAGGVIDEVRGETTHLASATAARMIGLPDLHDYIAGRLDLKACQSRIEAATRQYAKRQTTWFKREAWFAMVNLTRQPSTAEQLAVVESMYRDVACHGCKA